MATTPPPNAASEALDALRRGDTAQARRLFEQAITGGDAGAGAHLGLAYACAALGDARAALAAADACLTQAPRELRALILKADLLAQAGDAPAAATFYRAVTRCAAEDGPLPPELQALAERAQAMVVQHEQRFEAHLRQHLAAAGGAPLSRRFQQSMEILLGRKQIYTQAPRQYYFPGLPQEQFFEREAFPWLAELEAATPRIREELLAVMAGPPAFVPYVQGDPTRPALVQGGLLNNPDWSAYYLWKNGVPVPEQVARCPQTMAALAHVPLTRMAGRSPSILFSQLRPGAHIPPHHGILNTRLIVHLPLIVPPGCVFRVGNETREWVEGQAWVFDDTIEHEALNPSDRTRVILLFEVWRPELSLAERDQVCTLFEAIDRERGPGPDWGI